MNQPDRARIENILGNFDWNPDPIVRDNIMFSGFLANQIAEMEAATGSKRFDEPGSLELFEVVADLLAWLIHGSGQSRRRCGLPGSGENSRAILKRGMAQHFRLTVPFGQGRDGYPGSPMGAVAPGYRADLVAFDPADIGVLETWVAGEASTAS